MINKRLLVKNLLAYVGENSFYDKKRKINFGQKEGKAKFLKHVCALANSNPKNNSYILIGVEDADNEVVGVDFYDDSKIQNLVNAYLDNPPIISYENIPFPGLPEGKVVGLVSITSSGTICALRKNIWKYYGGSVFFREGSISLPKVFDIEMKDINSHLVQELEQHSRNNITHTLDGVMNFMNERHKDLPAFYRVFKDQFVLCWAGHEKRVKDQLYYSRVDIELITEQVQLFYSALDEVTITYDGDSFATLEYVYLGIGPEKKYYPLEKTVITFSENGHYHIDKNLVFEPPQYDKAVLHHAYNTNNALVRKLSDKQVLRPKELRDLAQLPEIYLICYLNGFEEAKEKMEAAKSLIKSTDRKVYASLKESIRVLRKVRYN